MPPTPRHDHQSGEALSNVFTVLADDTRRFLIAQLSQVDGSVSVPRLASRLREWHGDAGQAGANPPELVLHHHHLPKLERMGFIERADGQVNLTATGELAEEVRRAATDRLRELDG